MVMAAAGALVIPAHLPSPVDGDLGAPGKKIAAPTSADFQKNQVEAYLGDSGIAYIRPGCKLTIVAVTNATPGNKPVVEFLLTDNFDQPLDRLGKVTPGPIAPGFILGAWDPATRYYIAYTGTPTTGTITSASRDQGGTYTDLEVGHYKYNFGQAIPANHDVKKAITLGVYAGRTLTDIIGKNYYATNVFKDFKTDGSAVKTGDVWANMDVNKSCNRCHDPLGGESGATQFHGGTRRDVKICVMCHNANKGADGQADAKAFFHKIHMGEYLPSVIAGTPYVFDGDWSTVAWPGNNNRAPYDCTTCHETSAPEKDVWNTRPTRKVCGSCHDDVNFATSLNHGTTADNVPPQLDDSQCAKCHQPQGDKEFDASVKGAHTVPEDSTQLKGLVATLDHIDNLLPGKSPTVYFKITDGTVAKPGAAVDGTTLARIGPMIGGPAFSYSNPGITGAQPLRESAATSIKFDKTTGLTSFAFVGKIPADWTGTVGVSWDIYRNVNLKRGDGKADISVRERVFQDVKYFSLDKSPVDERRVSVNIALCNNCHVRLGLHGGSRQNTQECVICHNPAAVAGTGTAAESFSFQRMIHRIHTGEELTQPYVIGSFSANEIRYPGDRRDCVKCHTSTGYLIPLADERGAQIGSVPTPNDYFSPQGPETAACLGCHDDRPYAAHAYLNTAPFGEACSSCHGAGSTYGVDKVHAR
jgi:OmcA/MtrC family decaheme c-type cytochrome